MVQGVFKRQCIPLQFILIQLTPGQTFQSQVVYKALVSLYLPEGVLYNISKNSWIRERLTAVKRKLWDPSTWCLKRGLLSGDVLGDTKFENVLQFDFKSELWRNIKRKSYIKF